MSPEESHIHEFAVGKPYNPRVRNWPEGGQYNYRGGNHEMLIMLTDPTPSERRGLRRGRMELALVVIQPVILLLYRILGAVTEWSDAPFSWHLVPEAERELPPVLEEGERPILQVIGIKANGGEVVSLRMVSVSPEFGTALHTAIREQAELPFDRNAYDQRLQRIYQSFPTSEDLVPEAVAQCIGGR